MKEKRITRLSSLKRMGYFYYSLIEILYCASNAASAYYVALFTQNGISNTSVGLILAANSAAGFLFPPLLGILADKFRSKRMTLMVVFGIALVSNAFIPFCGSSVLLMLITTTLGSASRFSGMSLLDAWVVTEISKPDLDGTRINYSAIRCWGSFGYATTCALFYLIITVSGSSVDISFYLCSCAAFFALMMAARGKHRETTSSALTMAKPATLKELKPGRLMKNYYFVTFLIVYILLNSSMGFVQSYIPSLLESVGGSFALSGLLNGIRAYSEIPIMLITPFIVRKLGYEKSLMITSVVYVIEQLTYLFATSPGMVLVGQILRGSASGILFTSAISYILALVPRSLSATAQTFAAGGANILSMAANLMSGYLIDWFGIRSLFVVSLILQGLALILFVITLSIGKAKKIPKYNPAEDPFELQEEIVIAK